MARLAHDDRDALLAGFPATAGFFGKINLIQAVVDNGYAWLGVAIVLGSAMSLAYYLRVIAAVWMRAPGETGRAGAVAGRLTAAGRPVIAGGSPEADGEEDAPRGARAARGDEGQGGGGTAPAGDLEPRRASGSRTCRRRQTHGSGRPRTGARGFRRLGARPAAAARSGLRRADLTLGTLFFGVYPSPLLDVARDAGDALTNLL
jgi:NADH-quinone oxidoreductase subunit N